MINNLEVAQGEQVLVKQSNKLELNKEERKMINQLFIRQFPLMGSMNYTRMQGQGFAWALQPMLKKIYTKREDYLQALKRNTMFFNTTPAMAPFIMGLTLSMEKENAANPDFDESSINAVKVGLMGPLAGLGDSFFWGTLRVIAAGVGIGLSTTGNFLGPIMFLLIYNIPNLLVRYYGAVIGYSYGGKYITSASESGLLQSITKAASIMGLMMVGAMSASMVSFTVKYPIVIGGAKIVLQEILDKLLIGFVPLVIVLVCFTLLRKKVNPNWILLGLVAFGFGCAVLGIL